MQPITEVHRGQGKLYEEVNLLDDRIHSNKVAFSTERLGAQIATINHHPSADLQATHGSLRGPSDAAVFNSCLIPSSLPSLDRLPASAFVSLLLYLLMSRLSSRNLGNDLDATNSLVLAWRLFCFSCLYVGVLWVTLLLLVCDTSLLSREDTELKLHEFKLVTKQFIWCTASLKLAVFKAWNSTALLY